MTTAPSSATTTHASPVQRAITWEEGEVCVDACRTKHGDLSDEQQSTHLAPCQSPGDLLGDEGDDQEDA